MVKFYFNECLPASYSGNIQSVFEDVMKQFIKLVKDEQLCVEKGIITHKMPSEIPVCDGNLKDLIFSISDRDVKKIAIAYFQKFPIDIHSEDEKMDEQNMEDFLFDKQDAFNLVVAYKMNWPLLSLPLSDSLCKDEILLKSINNEIRIPNWYGTNNQYIATHISEYIALSETIILQLQYHFEGKECIMSDEFKRDYKMAGSVIQEAILNKFTDAKKANLLFPATHDNNLVKHCEDIQGGDLYELRFKAFGGIRIYFSCTDDQIIIGGLGQKSTYESRGAQSADMSRANQEIKKLKN